MLRWNRCKRKGRERDSIGTPAGDAEVDEQVEESKRGSITASTENDKAEETPTTGSKHNPSISPPRGRDQC